ncbi:hypothetical protein CSOJ01_10778 [Colletotrichum sojae]|uniref:Uncharacterized protein n=1 Tax=Colletotrichum sojae TaxID=2175907 RepID=A0A8H6IZJ8_9PEZI|nr:hypothetical protein CSOJ01_10778 [Colletotrichum sojae]
MRDEHPSEQSDSDLSEESDSDLSEAFDLKLPKPPAPPKTLRDVNFTDLKSVAVCNSMLEFDTLPLISIGVIDYGGHTNGYGIKPGRIFLVPSVNTSTGPGSNNVVLDRGILGINKEVWMPEVGPDGQLIRHRSGDPRENRNVRQLQPRDEDSNTGFVFAQLGALCAFDGNYSGPDTMPDWRCASDRQHLVGPWRDTGYVVVVRLDKDGRQGHVYIIWDFVDEDPETGECEHSQTSDGKAPLPDICRLRKRCKDADRFSVAMIASDTTSLGLHRHLKIRPEVSGVRECQLVRATLVKDAQCGDLSNARSFGVHPTMSGSWLTGQHPKPHDCMNSTSARRSRRDTTERPPEAHAITTHLNRPNFSQPAPHDGERGMIMNEHDEPEATGHRWTHTLVRGVRLWG